MQIRIGSQYVFRYPPIFTTLPEYTEHANQVVTVVRELEDGVEYDGPKSGLPERMYEIRAQDGWIGSAWESELEPAGLP